MKILINCPGSFTHGLDSPERGEGRWAQNVARLLGKAGHDVFACSGESLLLGEGRPAPGVTLIRESEAKDCGMFDMYFDSAWYKGKVPPASALKYFHVLWLPQPKGHETDMPDNHYITYFFKHTHEFFLNENYYRTFFLPAPFCEVMSNPGFERKGLLWCSRLDSSRFVGPAKLLLQAVEEILEEHTDLVHNVLYTEFSNDIKFPTKSKPLPSLPFNKMTEVFYETKLSMPVMMQSCIFDCVCAGVPSLLWEDTDMPSECLKDLARAYGLLVEKNAQKGRIKEVILSLLEDEELYVSFTKSLQYFFKDHTEDKVLSHFDYIVESVF